MDALGFDTALLRKSILKETIEKLADENERERLRKVALENVERWSKLRKNKSTSTSTIDIRVVQDDWGVTTQSLTAEFGTIFAALNMANSMVFGGGYLSGMVAQEENMFRRTDCHFSAYTQGDSKGFKKLERIYYSKEKVDLLNAVNGRVYLDVDTPRICIRGIEDTKEKGLGYEWLPEMEIFPFYELRAAAVDLRGQGRYSDEETLHRVHSQFQTLKEKGIRHVVLSAFGCGAFQNPAERVARCYKRALEEYEADFDCVCFAIFHAGYGKNNFIPFQKVFFPQEH
mmetsp:Transcript_14516/g.17946  ORF Transcript_14516/g.17946 Transcript_14516/m.17946 type:complete len:286 (+) Transcript_14516:94-951(+)